MRIWIEEIGGRPLELTSQRADEGVQDFRWSDQNQIEIVQGARQDDADLHNRGNAVNTLSFRVEREHDTAALAERTVLEYKASVPVSGLLTVEAQRDDGSRASVLYCIGKRQRSEHTYMGSSTMHSYTFLCGPALTKKPPAF